jgi:hypothetical protein
MPLSAPSSRVSYTPPSSPSPICGSGSTAIGRVTAMPSGSMAARESSHSKPRSSCSLILAVGLASMRGFGGAPASLCLTMLSPMG